MTPKTFEELAVDEVGTIYVDAIENGVRYIIMRGPASLCAYLGVPKDHPLWGFDCELVQLNVHGGLTYASEGKGRWPSGWYWYGWDYAHAGDYSFYSLEWPSHDQTILKDEKKWVVEDVQAEMWDATYDFEKLMRLAERIAANTQHDVKKREEEFE